VPLIFIKFKIGEINVSNQLNKNDACLAAIQKLVSIIQGCVFETDRRNSEPSSLLWTDYKKAVNTLRENGYKINGTFL